MFTLVWQESSAREGYTIFNFYQKICEKSLKCEKYIQYLCIINEINIYIASCGGMVRIFKCYLVK